MPVTGYPSATSVPQGGAVGIHLSATPAQDVGIVVSRVGAPVVDRWSDSVAAGPLAIPPGGGQAGYRWPAAAEIAIGADWPSGLYRVSLSAADGGREDFHFAVRAADPGTTSPVLLMYPATTGQAYNPTGGASLYEFNSPNGVAADRVSFDRPGGLEYGIELPFAGWFDAAGIATEACTSLDLHESPELPGRYRLVVSMGHDEYWSREMRDALEDYVTRGGNVAFFSGNVCWWQGRFEDGGRSMVCHKDAAADPFAGVDNSRVTVNWADVPVCRPENALTGVGWRRGAQVSGNGAFTCASPSTGSSPAPD